MDKLTHINSNGDAIMVDISNKDITSRIAQASGTINMSREAFCAIIEGTVKKGDALSVARIAGIMAAKKTYSLIPLCHQIPLSRIKVEILPIKDEYAFRVISTVKTDYKTGVEMEALTAVNIALLTIYDMAKAIDKGMIISNIHLIKKSGGKSGTYTNE